MAKYWDAQLWDTFDPHMYNFSKFNFDFGKSFNSFLKARSKIEKTYCKELRKLCADFRPKEYNKKASVRFSLQEAFEAALKQLLSIAEQREQSVTKLDERHLQLKLELTDLRKEAAAAERKIGELFSELQSSRKRAEESRSIYHRAHAELTKAMGAATVDTVLEQRRQGCDNRLSIYRNDLLTFNKMQKSLYQSRLPEQLSRFEVLQRNLFAVCRNGMSEWAKMEAATLNQQARSTNAMLTDADSVNTDSDMATFASITASGKQLPSDVPFVEAPTAQGHQSFRELPAPSAVERKASSASLSIPSETQAASASHKVPQDADKIRQQIEGLKKLRDAYQKNPSTGDVSAVESQLQLLIKQLPEPPKVSALNELYMEDCVEEDTYAEIQKPAPTPPPMDGSFAIVLYDYNDPSQTSSLVVTKGERVRILESDSDWALVSRLEGSDNGYVPASYLSSEAQKERQTD